MILASAALLLVTGIVPLHLIAEKAVSQISLFPLLAIPGFIVAGELMNLTGLTQALGELARALVGRWRGGMGLATVLACMIFGGMTGSGLAETVAIGTLMIPMLRAARLSEVVLGSDRCLWRRASGRSSRPRYRW